MLQDRSPTPTPLRFKSHFNVTVQTRGGGVGMSSLYLIYFPMPATPSNFFSKMMSSKHMLSSGHVQKRLSELSTLQLNWLAFSYWMEAGLRVY